MIGPQIENRWVVRFNLCFIDKYHELIKQGERTPLVTPSVYLSKEEVELPSPQKKLLKALQGGRLKELSARERECVFYMAKGHTAAQVAKIMYISRRTVEAHLRHAKDKLLVRKVSDLIKFYPEW